MSVGLLDEALDPATAPERLRELTKAWAWQVANAACANPSLPTEAHLELLVRGNAAAWSNPQTPFTLLMHGNDEAVLQGALLAADAYWSPRRGIDLEALQQNLASILDPWWETTNEGTQLWAVRFVVRRILGGQGAKDSIKEVTRALVAQSLATASMTYVVRRGCTCIENWLGKGFVDLLDEAIHLARMSLESLEKMEVHSSSDPVDLETLHSRTVFTAVRTLAELLREGEGQSLYSAEVVARQLVRVWSVSETKAASETLTEADLQACLRRRNAVLAQAVRQQQPHFPWVQDDSQGSNDDEDEER